MSLCEASRRNEAFYPTKHGKRQRECRRFNTPVGRRLQSLGIPFPADFDAHCRRVLRLLWHCVGHIYAKHWELMALLNLRPQCGLILAHLTAISKLFALLDAKELASLISTLSLVRPPCLQAPPAKRSGGVGENFGLIGGVEMAIGDAPIVAATTAADYPTWSASAKSGSWGGHSMASRVVAHRSLVAAPSGGGGGGDGGGDGGGAAAKSALISSNSYAAQTC